MNSFLSFGPSATASTSNNVDTARLQVIVTPSSSAFYAGDVFSASIRFAQSTDVTEPPPSSNEVNSAIRPAPQQSSRHVTRPEIPKRCGRIGKQTTRERPPVAIIDYPYSPGANPAFRAPGPAQAKGTGHGRRTQSLALGKAVSPQEMVRALGPSKKTVHTRHISLASPRSPLPRQRIKVLWAYTRLVALFHPSNAHIPPDPLLPLRSMLLHQPVGSGSFNVETKGNWQMSFGTGSLGMSTQPSLTGSLFGLAKDLVSGGKTSSLDDERKRVWNMKDLPVFESARSLIGVDFELGDDREFAYSIALPKHLPPTYRGKAYKFTYELVVSVNLLKDGKQEMHEVRVPIRVWGNVSLQPAPSYDILQPVIQTKEEGRVAAGSDRRPELRDGVESYARGLLRREEDDMADGQESCGQAVEVLSRHSHKVSYDIAKDGRLVAVLTLVKSTFRLGESVLGSVEFRDQVLQFSSMLETHEQIPETLRPEKVSPIIRLQAEQSSRFTGQHARYSFQLDIPSEATPTFAIAAGEGKEGGLEWRVRLSFLVGLWKLQGKEVMMPEEERKTEVINCEIPIRVLAGNTAFVVRPSMHTL